MSQLQMDLTDRASHFEFGQNWASYSKLIDESRLAMAYENVRALAGDLRGKTFLDIGSGSGLFSLSALRLGASRVLAIDIDENSVATTQSVLTTNAPPGSWEAQRISVFDLSPETHGEFDVVYSWGVLHHTGDMWTAIGKAAAMVKPGGMFAFALYEKTPICGFWKKEKQFYTKAPRAVQNLLRSIYYAIYVGGLTLAGRNPLKRLREISPRGMDIKHDVHDWMGGYPYESTTPEEVESFMMRLGFSAVAQKPVKIHALGILGSGCSEYVYQKAGA